MTSRSSILIGIGLVMSLTLIGCQAGFRKGGPVTTHDGRTLYGTPPETELIVIRGTNPLVLEGLRGGGGDEMAVYTEWEEGLTLGDVVRSIGTRSKGTYSYRLLRDGNELESGSGSLDELEGKEVELQPGDTIVLEAEL